MNSAFELKAIATFLEVKGYHCSIDEGHLFPLRILSPDGNALAGIWFDRGGWGYRLGFDAFLAEARIDKEKLKKDLEEAITYESMPTGNS